MANSIEGSLECSICSDEFTDPRALPCLHTFCFNCLVDLHKKSATNGVQISCPLCRQEFRIPDVELERLPRNFHVEQFIGLRQTLTRESAAVDDGADQKPKCMVCAAAKPKSNNNRMPCTGKVAAAATMSCWQCDQVMCTGCAKTHAERRKHRVVELRERNCERHPTKPLDVYCEFCAITCCEMCAVEHHVEHAKTSIKEATKNMREKLVGYAVNIATKRDGLRKSMAALKINSQTLDGRSETAESRVATRVAALKAEIDYDSGRLVADVRRYKLETGRRMDVDRKKLDNTQKQMNGFIVKCNELVKTGSPPEIIDQFKVLNLIWQELLTFDGSADLTVPDLNIVECYHQKFLPNNVKSLVGRLNVSDCSNSAMEDSLPSWDELYSNHNLQKGDDPANRMDQLTEIMTGYQRFAERATNVLEDVSNGRLQTGYGLQNIWRELNRDMALIQLAKHVGRRDTAIICLLFVAITTLVAGCIFMICRTNNIVWLHNIDLREGQAQIARIALSSRSSERISVIPAYSRITGLTLQSNEIYVRCEIGDKMQIYSAVDFRLINEVVLFNWLELKTKTVANVDIASDDMGTSQYVYIFVHHSSVSSSLGKFSTLKTYRRPTCEAAEFSFWWKTPQSFKQLVVLLGKLNILSIIEDPLISNVHLIRTEVLDRTLNPAISISSDSNIIITYNENGIMTEHTSSGKLVREIPMSNEITSPNHAVKLSESEYIVCYGSMTSLSFHGVAIIGVDGKVKRRFGSLAGYGSDRVYNPVHLAVSGLVFVADYGNSRVVMLSPDLQFVREVVTGVLPFRIAFDFQLARLYVADDMTNTVQIFSLLA